MTPGRSNGPLVGGLLLIWLIVVSAGLAGLWRYAETPGPAATAAATWPDASHVMRDTHRPTLIVFAHPQCACSRASLGELSVLMTHVQHRVTVKVLFYRPSGAADNWVRSDLWQSAAVIPGVEVAIDENGNEASAFGAAASGQTLLYDASGHLMFSGGITAARGHAGDNAGRRALLSLLTGGDPATAHTPVFGCILKGAPAADPTMTSTRGTT
jgi:hypothetical protein